MKKIKEMIFAVAMLVLCFAVSACEVQYYSAVMLVSTKTTNSASVSFDSLKGTYKTQLYNRGSDEVFITYQASLGEGTINVYYTINNEKLSLFEIETNGVLSGKSETFTGNKTINIAIESNEKSKDGSFSFVLNKA